MDKQQLNEEGKLLHEQWHIEECEKIKREEKRLADVSKFSYNAVNYLAQLEREAWIEPTLPDFEPLIDEAKRKVRSYYNIVMVQRVLVFIFGFLLMPFIPIEYVLFVMVPFVIAMGVLIFTVFDARRKKLIFAEKKARQGVELKIRKLKAHWKKQREDHEKWENTRILCVNQILSGNFLVLVNYINNMLAEMHLAVEISAYLKVCAGTPQIIVELPSKAHVPKLKVITDKNGVMKIEGKEQIEIHKQHLELCCAVIMRVLTTVASASPIFEQFYVNGVFDVHCYISVSANKESVAKACEQQNAVAAISALKGRVQTTETFAIKEVEPLTVSEWGDFSKDKVSSFTLKCPSF